MAAPSTKKSVLAAGLGVLLLTGVGGSFARWSEAEAIPGGTVTAGHLGMTLSGGGWYVNGVPYAGDIADFRMVPGDTARYRVDVDPDVVGDNLEAELTADIAGLDGALEDNLMVTSSIDGQATRTLTPESTAGGTTFPAVVSIAFPYDDAARSSGDLGEGEALDLSTLQVSLVQTPGS